MKLSWAKITLFLAGMFCGGVIDHVILALMGSPETPFGIRSGVMGNWLFAVFDAAVTAVLYIAHRRFEMKANVTQVNGS
jgi:hypothetical protein